ncbi:DNA polymerase subunit beta [Candidatus Desulfarcum epimagneticum]|uniref:DNA polymerase subunit beta n=1 Tax=uncultured Desulfobacteraceae bacterium TaxID=218296 RepID=A0A484HH27_9BACT|nr:DNA polymerase subunit beta [uncultured Desulfobacteraceae bacterium]
MNHLRLTDFEKKTIQSTASAVFGLETKVFLFGSRLNDALKGGDIDLYIEPRRKVVLQDKIKFLSTLKWKLGDQKIDVLIDSKDNREKSIYKTARETGIEI